MSNEEVVPSVETEATEAPVSEITEATATDAPASETPTA